MSSVIFAALLACLPGVSSIIFDPPGIRTYGGVWPLPAYIQYANISLSLGSPATKPITLIPSIQIANCDVIVNALDVYENKWFFPFDHSVSNGNVGGNISLQIFSDQACSASDKLYPTQGIDESYKLTVPDMGDAVLHASTIWGVLRGLDTFSQLIYVQNGSYFLRSVIVSDTPRFPLRGVMLDTGRHYLPKRTIFRQLDAMQQHKMNFFHWHLVDDPSFPYVSTLFPSLSSVGAYTPKHIYTPSDIQDIINYARLRGIRVMPEFDTPAHVTSWKGQKELLSLCFNSSVEKLFAKYTLIDPTKEENYQFLKTFIGEVVSVFPEKFLHLGGDEASYLIQSCWMSNPNISQFMNSHNVITANDMQTYYINRMHQTIASEVADRQLVYWQEIFDSSRAPAGSTIHIWKSGTECDHAIELERVTAAGYTAIFSACWYLNRIQWAQDWRSTRYVNPGDGRFYQCDPTNFNGTDTQKKLVLGGIAALWGEYVDATNIEAQLWPRASAPAERLWSVLSQTLDPDVAWPRLHEHRCRLIARGYRVQPNNGPDFCDTEWSDS